MSRHRALGTCGGKAIGGCVWALCALGWLAIAQPGWAQAFSPVAGMERGDDRAVAYGKGEIGDGGPATEALLANPFSVSSDGEGNLYIADTSHLRIRKVDAQGQIVTVAGSGDYGFSGDGGPATEARLADPIGVCADRRGGFYIADTFNHRVRRVNASGIIMTVAGTGAEGFSGDGGPAAEAQLARPTGVFVDGAGTLYIADTFNHRVRKVDASGTITTVAGTGQAGFSGDGGPAVEAQLAHPFGIFVDAAGTLYIADRSNHRIRKVDAAGVMSTVAGNGEPGFTGDGGWAADAGLKAPSWVSLDSAGNLYIADTGNGRIRRVDPSGRITTVAGDGAPGFSGDGRMAARAGLDSPYGVHVDGAGALYVADTGNHRVCKVHPQSREIRIRTDSGTIAADGRDALSIEVQVFDLDSRRPVDGVPVAFHIFEGAGILSGGAAVTVDGRAQTRVSSRAPGRLAVSAVSDGAWGVTASAEAMPVREVQVSAVPVEISANGFDVSVLKAEIRDLGDGVLPEDNAGVRFRIVEGAGRLAVEEATVSGGRALTSLAGVQPGRVTVQVTVPGARPATVSVDVTRPAPGQLPDAFEPDNEMAAAKAIPTDGSVQARTMHTRGEVDWAAFDVSPGYRYTVSASGEIDVGFDVYDRRGELVGRHGAQGEFRAAGGMAGRVYLALRAAGNRSGRYALSVRATRDAILAVQADPGVIAGDGVDASVVEVQILDLEGNLQGGDSESRVVFEVVEGEAVLSAREAQASGGKASTRVTSRSPGRVRIKAGVDAVAPAAASVTVTPAVALDLDLAPGDQGRRAAWANAGDRVGVDLAAVSGAEGIVGFQARLAYDPGRLRFAGFQAADLMAGGTPILAFPREGQVEINAAILGGRTEEDRGSLGTATFLVLDRGTGGAAVTLASAAYGTPAGQQQLKVGSTGASVVIGRGPDAPEPVAPPATGDFQGAFGRREGEPGYDVRLDLNGDGQIGFDDFVIFCKQVSAASRMGE